MTPGDLWDQDQFQTSISVNVDHRPFWEVVNLLGQQTGLFPLQESGGSGKLTLQSAGKSRCTYPVAFGGPCMFRAELFSHTRMVEYISGEPRIDNTSMNLGVFIDPKIKVTKFSQFVVVDSAEDDLGQSMLPDPARRQNYFGGQMSLASHAWDASAMLKYPAKPGKKIARLKGHVTFDVQVKSEMLTIPNLLTAKEVTITAGHYVMTVHNTTKEGTGSGENGNYQVKFTASRDASVEGPFNYWELINYIQVQDAQGHALTNLGIGSGRIEKNTAELTARFQSVGKAIGAPATLLWEAITESKELSVPFEFKDLPLP